MRELSYFFAPNINSYKRYQAGSFAPTAVMWGIDNRTCAVRVVGHGPSLRFENRVPGGDVNPYLAVSAMIAAGLHGLENELPLEAAFGGNAYVADAPRVPTSLAQAARMLEASYIAREAMGDVVIDHYTNAADVEIAAYDAAVTDWERIRSFERM
jgi:glutamine synthetase